MGIAKNYSTHSGIYFQYTKGNKFVFPVHIFFVCFDLYLLTVIALTGKFPNFNFIFHIHGNFKNTRTILLPKFSDIFKDSIGFFNPFKG